MSIQLEPWVDKSGVKNRGTFVAELEGAGSNDHDSNDLARVGKKQVLKRSFGLASMIGFASIIVSLWETILLSFQLGLVNGGPAGLIYGYLVAWAAMTCVYITLGELASMIPTSGGQYHWVSIFAPDASKTFLSYICGWLTLVGWVGSIASTSFFSGSMLQAVISLNYPDYNAERWQVTLLMWAFIVAAVLFNTAFSRALPAIEVCILVIHVLGFFAVFIPIIYLTPKGLPTDIFTTFSNGGNWPTQGLSFMVGLSGNAAAFIGMDGAVHMSEEVIKATTNVPRAMFFGTFFNGLLAWAMLITFLYCAGNISDAEANAPYPYIPILARITGSNAAASVIASLLIVLQFCACIGCAATTSRMMWAFARDRGLPNWRFLMKIETRAAIPVRCLLVAAVPPLLFGLINIGSTSVFQDIISLVLVSLYGTYIIACATLLYRRVRGDIAVDDSTWSGEKFTWGPWRVRGVLGVVTNSIAVAYLITLAFFSFWPQTAQVTAVDMNYSSLLFGSAIFFSMAYYVVYARKVYKGPIVEV